MVQDDVESYVVKKGFSFHRQGDELVLEICPFCGDQKGRFNINKLMGLWQCFKCGETGNLWTLKERVGDIQKPSKVAEVFGEDVSYDVVSREEVGLSTNQLQNDPSALKWLTDRGLSWETTFNYGLGVVYEESGRWITIPYFKDSKWVNVKYRSLPPTPKQYRFKPKHEKPLYNGQAIKHNKDVLLVEGEIDCLSAIEMGFPRVASLPYGAGNFSSDHWDELVGCSRIYLVLDFDGAGREGAIKVARRLGEDRCFNVNIPNGMDINDLLVKYKKDEGKKRLSACIEDAKPFGVGEVSSVLSALQQLEDHIKGTGSAEVGFASPWPSVNRVCGLVGPGEVLLLLAIQKTGKTTFAQQWLSWLALTHNVPTMMYCLEMPLWRLAQSLVAGVTKKSRREIATLEVKMAMLRFREAPYYYGAVPKQWDFEHIKDVITYSVKRFGVQFVCFDNLQLLCRSVHDVWQEQAVVSREFKKLASELGIAILLVVQPRKINPKSSPGMYDPSGSGSIIADADGMLSLWRKPSHNPEEVVTEECMRTEERESFGPETLVRVPASRYRAGGQAMLYFDGDLATFVELAERG